LQLRAGVAQFAEVRFELTDRGRVPVRGRGPAFENFGADVGQPREALFDEAWIAVDVRRRCSICACRVERRCSSSPFVSTCISCAHVTQILHAIQQHCDARST
jgi:hypothetical protein